MYVKATYIALNMFNTVNAIFILHIQKKAMKSVSAPVSHVSFDPASTKDFIAHSFPTPDSFTFRTKFSSLMIYKHLANRLAGVILKELVLNKLDSSSLNLLYRMESVLKLSVST